MIPYVFLPLCHYALTYHVSVSSLRATLVLYCKCRLQWNHLPFILHLKRERGQRETLDHPAALNGITRHSGTWHNRSVLHTDDLGLRSGLSGRYCTCT